ncbi:MAG: hypothetical protein JWQ08_1111 [Deinococcus sp.]|nr:hypothetical protein [Deinococcus sp.]
MLPAPVSYGLTTSRIRLVNPQFACTRPPRGIAVVQMATAAYRCICRVPVGAVKLARRIPPFQRAHAESGSREDGREGIKRVHDLMIGGGAGAMHSNHRLIRRVRMQAVWHSHAQESTGPQVREDQPRRRSPLLHRQVFPDVFAQKSFGPRRTKKAGKRGRLQQIQFGLLRAHPAVPVFVASADADFHRPNSARCARVKLANTSAWLPANNS